jgi:SAM-dependent methyltransferase
MLYSAACERNKAPILAVLRAWLPPGARVLEIGSGSGQHARFFCQQLAGLHWQCSERPEAWADLAEALAAAAPGELAPGELATGASLPAPISLEVRQTEPWPGGDFDAVFTANTCHIMPEAALAPLLAGSRQALRPGGRLLLYGPFHDNGVPSAASNAAFDAHLRSLDPAMGVRDAVQLQAQARSLGFAPLADIAMPANNRILIFAAPP